MTPALELFTFDGGMIYTASVKFLNEAGELEDREMRDPNHAYLIRHPDGLLAWDAGLPDAIAALPDGVLKRGRFRFAVRQTLAGQYAALGIAPQQVDYLAFSHLQIDHAGNAGLFNTARVLVQQAEYEMAFSKKAEQWGYRREDYESITGQDVLQLNGDLDVFGDGRVLLLSAPGHTPGHQVLFVDLPEGPVLLSGDQYYQHKDPQEGWLPAWNYDMPQARQSAARLAQFARQRGARWVINHQPETYSTF